MFTRLLPWLLLLSLSTVGVFVVVSRPPEKEIVVRYKPLPPITRQADLDTVLRHFHLGTIRTGVNAYSQAGTFRGSNLYTYVGGRQPNRWRVDLVLEDPYGVRSLGVPAMPE